MRGIDGFDVIANLALSVAPLTSEPGDGSDGTRLLSLPELTALLFAENGCGGEGRRADGGVLERVDLLVTRLLHVSSFRENARLVGTKSSYGVARSVVPRLTAAAETRELYLRLPRFHQKERELLGQLFTPEIQSTLTERLGFGPSSIFMLFDTYNSRLPQLLADLMREAEEELRKQTESSAELRAQLDSRPEDPDELRQRIVGNLAFDRLRSAAGLTLDDVVNDTGLNASEVHLLLARMSIELDGPNQGVVSAFLRGDNVMRTRPFVSRTRATGEREWLLVQPTSLIFGMRELLEEALMVPMDQAYIKHRGALLESRGMKALVAALHPDVALGSVEYTVPGLGRFETDGLLVLGHVAIVLEAKSNRLTQVARTGAAQRLWLELGPIITKAADQAERLRGVLQSSDTLRIRSANDLLHAGAVERNSDLNIKEVTEIFTIALSLEDLNYVATVTADLVESGLIDEGVPSPWVVNLHDLEVAASLFAHPAIFIQFLGLRRDVAADGRVVAVDELDYVMLYLSGRLTEIVASGAPTMVTSLTDELDAWIFYEAGLRETPASKPALPIDRDTSEMLQALETHRPVGWLGASIALLSAQPDRRADIAREPMRLRDLSARDRKPHSMYLETPELATRSTIFVILSFPLGTRKAEIERQLIGYGKLRAYASMADCAYCFAAWVGSRERFDAFLALEETWARNDDLETRISDSGIADGLKGPRPDSRADGG